MRIPSVSLGALAQLPAPSRDARPLRHVAAYDNSVRIGCARVSTRAQDHQAQLDALAAAHCREIVAEIPSTRGDRPKLREALGTLQAGDTLVIYKPDRVARSMKELLVLPEGQLQGCDQYGRPVMSSACRGRCPAAPAGAGGGR